MASNKYKEREETLKKLTNKKVNELSTFLGIDSGPSTKLIANIQSRINNPLFKLSINDYEVMCGNNTMINMMSKVLDCNVNQLKKFCKYVNVFKENIKSSPKSIKNKMIAAKNINASKMRGSLNLLPDDIYYSIVNKYKTIFKVRYVLKDWIPLNKLKKEFLSENPNAVDYLKKNNHLIDWKSLCRNPNPEAIALLIENKNNISNYYELLLNNISLTSNLTAITNPAAIEYIKDVLNKDPNQIEWDLLSKNPSAIELLKKKIQEEAQLPDYLLRDLDNSKKIDWWGLSKNPNAIELLQANRTKIDWSGLSANTNLKAIELLKANSDNIDWDVLSSNPNAIELLKENLDKIVWIGLSANTNLKLIELLKANPNNIDWNVLSYNPSAIELLKANKYKINWYDLCANTNPEALELLKEKMDTDNNLRIDWYALSANPSIFEGVLE
jgi:hypothetical protein